MSNRFFSGRRLARRSRWLLAFLLFYLVFMVLSTTRSQASEDPWDQLKSSIDSLPTAISDWQQNLIEQVTQLRSRNALLQTKNESLTSRLKDSQTSLDQSKAEVKTSSAKLSLSNQALTASMQSTAKVQVQAKALEAQNKILKWSLGIVAAAAVVYFGGKVARLW